MKSIDVVAIQLLFLLGEHYYRVNETKQWEGEDICGELELKVNEINDAVELLDANGEIRLYNYKNSPFNFGAIAINVHGKRKYQEFLERLKEDKEPSRIGFH